MPVFLFWPIINSARYYSLIAVWPSG
jgi:hypothetical protein